MGKMAFFIYNREVIRLNELGVTWVSIAPFLLVYLNFCFYFFPACQHCITIIELCGSGLMVPRVQKAVNPDPNLPNRQNRRHSQAEPEMSHWLFVLVWVMNILKEYTKERRWKKCIKLILPIRCYFPSSQPSSGSIGFTRPGAPHAEIRFFQHDWRKCRIVGNQGFARQSPSSTQWRYTARIGWLFSSHRGDLTQSFGIY